MVSLQSPIIDVEYSVMYILMEALNVDFHDLSLSHPQITVHLSLPWRREAHNKSFSKYYPLSQRQLYFEEWLKICTLL